jgi:hypothetical protein
MQNSLSFEILYGYSYPTGIWLKHRHEQINVTEIHVTYIQKAIKESNLSWHIGPPY